jgi:hypothetical protein
MSNYHTDDFDGDHGTYDFADYCADMTDQAEPEEAECTCHFMGDMADASGCDVHGEAIPRKPVSSAPHIGQTTVVEQWDGTRWIERTLVWDGTSYVREVA